ncbi:MAG: hypothetical protein R3C26_23325 [Calditrichia bacterium]
MEIPLRKSGAAVFSQKRKSDMPEAFPHCTGNSSMPRHKLRSTPTAHPYSPAKHWTI